MNKKTNKVIVLGDDFGNVITASQNNPEYGYIKLQQNVLLVDHNNWVQHKKRHCIITGKLEDLKALDFKANQELEGKIIVKEQCMPFSEYNSEKELKMAGNTNVVCRIDDQPIYRKAFFTTNLNEQDILLEHTNREEIKEALEDLKNVEKIINETVNLNN